MKSQLLKALKQEFYLRRDYLLGEKIKTIYFGGGTPSLLTRDELMEVFDEIHSFHEVDKAAEITLEANPDDLTKEFLKSLSSTPVNRLSIGLQSFRDEDLKMMNRSHTASQSDYAVKISQDVGFENISADLIYAIPGLSDEEWMKNVEKAIALNVPHISAYCLTIEDKTAFGYRAKRGELVPTEADQAGEQFLQGHYKLVEAGFDHYEVSNFCKPDFMSRHNTSYWRGEKYLGLGPSAHSFDGKSRQWNVSSNPDYILSLKDGKLKHELELLDDHMRLNEYIMTGLRTMEGIDLSFIETRFGISLMKLYEKEILEMKANKKMLIEKNQLKLTKEGWLLADRIASHFFITSD